ncbi:Zinc transporter zip3 [Plakobranchus ocellatus]|uniref:Zinc transporter zip3 n=1 Tax=Plakobranchus ocellatus TaxID=259542 RepID=A0AAV4CR26_9GAST|nr:Zinc transporter zip3 [Plakobranchus ocellatus]
MYSDSRKFRLFMNKSSPLAAFTSLLRSLPFATTLLIVAPEAYSTSTTTPTTTTTTVAAAVDIFRAIATKAPAPSGSGGVEAANPEVLADPKTRQQQDIMDVVVTKIISMLVLALLSVLCGLLPLRMLIHSPNIFNRNRGPMEYFLCGLRLFSGGIYLATCFLHLMPDTRVKMTAVMLNMGSRTTYAVPELLVICGFYAVVFVEQIIQALYVKAQQSDVRKKRRRPKPHTSREQHRKYARTAKSSQDEESSHGDGDMGEMAVPPVSVHNNNRSCMRHSEEENEDEEEEDDDDDVLVDEEEDMSFDNSESDDKSVDSMTQAKEKLIDADTVHQYMRDSQQGNTPSSDCLTSQVVPTSTVHFRHNSTNSPVLKHQNCNNSGIDSEVVLLKTFCPVTSSDTLPRRPVLPDAHYSSGPPPTIHIHNHQHRPPRPSKEMNHYGPHPHFHYHHNQYHQRKQSPPIPSSPPSPSHSSHANYNREKESKDETSDQKVSSIQTSPLPQEVHRRIPTSMTDKELPKTSLSQNLIRDNSPTVKMANVQYPVIDKLKESPGSETSRETLYPQDDSQWLPTANAVDGSRKATDSGGVDGCHKDVLISISAAAPFTHTPPITSGSSSSCRPNKSCSSSQEDSGIFSARRDLHAPNNDCEKLTALTPSREVSFDQISDCSSQLQDIQVKRVVDELSRGNDSNRAHFRSIIYIMALSFHGIFEGMALGLQSMKSSVWALCFAIIMHRCVLAFKLGMDLCRGEEKHGTAFLCIGTFTLISILGIIIGILICSGASLVTDITVPEAILQSLATGTIFYIVFFDILFKDLEGKDDLKRVSCSFVGFALMAVVFAVTRN